MKGVVLAGGLGTRLSPLTNITNKHLLPVWDKPMIFYPLEMLRNIGIEDVVIVVGGKSTGEIVRLVGDGRQFGFKNVYYAFQRNEGGIAEALSLAERFNGPEPMCVVLGDNVIEKNIKQCVEEWKELRTSAHIILTEVENPQDFGCPIFKPYLNNDSLGKIISVEEKPKNPTTKYIVSGIYFYDCSVFNIIRNIVPSQRQEFEISDVNNWWAELNKLKDGLFLSYSILDGWWGDAGGSIEGLYNVSMKVKETGANKL
jgi:glucose-1-phosphate thymidylyltransferase